MRKTTLFLSIVFALAGCKNGQTTQAATVNDAANRTSTQGPAGPAGPAGPPGPRGPAGGTPSFRAMYSAGGTCRRIVRKNPADVVVVVDLTATSYYVEKAVGCPSGHFAVAGWGICSGGSIERSHPQAQLDVGWNSWNFGCTYNERRPGYLAYERERAKTDMSVVVDCCQ